MLVLLCAVARAGVVDVSQLSKDHLGTLGLSAEVFTEEADPLSLGAARALYAQGRFVPGTRPALSFGIGARPVWVRLALFNPGDGPNNYYATLGATWIDQLDVYLVRADGIAVELHAGDALPGAPGIRVGLVTRNITNEPMLTIRKVLSRHDIDLDAFDFAVHVPLREDKTHALRSARKSFDINPARSYACGDEHKDFTSAIAAGMHAFIGSYGFEDYTRLTKKFQVPEDVISRTPEDLSIRVHHALDIGPFECR